MSANIRTSLSHVRAALFTVTQTFNRSRSHPQPAPGYSVFADVWGLTIARAVSESAGAAGATLGYRKVHTGPEGWFRRRSVRTSAKHSSDPFI